MTSPTPLPPPPAPARGGWRKWIVTVGGSGLSPVAPGTAGSLATILLLALIYWAFEKALGRPMSWLEWNGLLLAGLLISSAFCVALGKWTFQYFNREDPGPCVIDEFAGICLTGLFLPIYAGWRWIWVLLAMFAAFRVFDVLKPPPAKQLENLPDGWGILMDDLMAAVYANIVCQILLRFF